MSMHPRRRLPGLSERPGGLKPAVLRRVAPLTLLLGAVGCVSAPGPVFPEISPPIVWPRPPDAARIRYLGQLTGQASLKVKPRGWAAVRAAIRGTRPAVRFSTPTAVAVRGERVYVADGQLGVIHVLDLAARTYQVVAQAAGERLQNPVDVAMAGEHIAVADGRRGAVFLFAADGTYARTVGQNVLQRPVALAWKDAEAELWVIDAGTHACVVFDERGMVTRRIGGRGTAAGLFNFPTGIAYREPFGAVVADALNFRVQLFDAKGRAVGMFGQAGNAAGDFSLPRDVAIDSAGHIYVLDSRFENVQLFDRSGRLLMAFGREGRGPGEFYLPTGITIDERDRIWIADTYNRRVQVFQYIAEAAS